MSGHIYLSELIQNSGMLMHDMIEILYFEYSENSQNNVDYSYPSSTQALSANASTQGMEVLQLP